MKCISLWQPWATLVVIGAKRFETRHWLTCYQGPLLIHAAKRFTRADFQMCCEEPFRSALFPKGAPPIRQYKRCLGLGYIIGMVELVECHPTELNGPKGISISDTERAFGNFADKRFAWELRNPKPFRVAIPYCGMQALFNVPVEIVAEQMRGVGAA